MKHETSVRCRQSAGPCGPEDRLASLFPIAGGVPVTELPLGMATLVQDRVDEKPIALRPHLDQRQHERNDTDQDECREEAQPKRARRAYPEASGVGQRGSSKFGSQIIGKSTEQQRGGGTCCGATTHHARDRCQLAVLHHSPSLVW